MPVAPFKLVLPGGAPAPVLAHIPHASTEIPSALRQSFVVDEQTLKREIVRLTDWDADHLFSWVLRAGGSMFVNQLSRLVFDPERFADDEAEPMAAVGQGVVYTRTTDGLPLAAVTPEERAKRIEQLYMPYHEGLDGAVTSLLERFGIAVILDCHSFPTVPLPSDLDQSPERPDICIGTDAFHTPEVLVRELVSGFEDAGFTVAVDSPYAGTLVPLRYLSRDRRVISVMVEVRRGLYCDERTGERLPEFDAVRDKIEWAVGPAVVAVLRGAQGR